MGGQFSDALQEVLTANGCQTAVFLTAANPGGVKTSDTSNLQAESQLAILWRPTTTIPELLMLEEVVMPSDLYNNSVI